MPLYEYECTKCHRRTEKIEKASGPHLKKCPHCAGKVERLIGAPAIQFKGSGWYVTDYAGKKSAASDPASTGAAGDGGTKESSAKEPAKESTRKEAKETKETKETKAKK